MNLLNKSRKAFTATVVAATIAWSMGLSAMTAAAAVPATGSLIKASLPTVYYLGDNNKRYVFPNAKTYSTWYADFSSVQTITDAELAAIPLGGNVTYRPGVRMVKITTDPKVYAVAKGGVLRWVTSESVAVALYGANWNQMIDDVPDSFFTNYTIGADINAAGDFMPATETGSTGSINADKGLSSGGSTVSGSLSAMLSSSQPMGGTLPLGAMGVAMVKVDVKNMGSAAATLDSMTVRRSGVGASGDFANVYAYEGMNRLTTGRTINTSTNEATFSNLGVMLAAGETKTLWVSADISGTAAVGNQNALQVVSIMSGMTSVSGLPLGGPTFNIAGAVVGSLTIDKNGTLSNVKSGSMGAKVAEFKLTAGATEDVVLHKVALYYAGITSRSNLTNLVLKQGGNTLSSVAGIASNDLVTFVLSSPMTLEKGASRIFEVYADLSASARSETAVGDIKFFLDQNSDLNGVGATYGYGVTVTNASYTGTGANFSIAEIEAGQLNATFNGPAAMNVARDVDGVELFNYTLSAQANLEVRETNIKVTMTTVGASDVTVIDNLKIVDAATGAIVAGPYDMVAVALTETKAFTEVYNLTAGQSRTFKVLADISAAALSGDTVTVTLGNTQLFEANKVRNLDTSNYLTAADMVPSAVITGNTHTIQAPSLVASKSSTPVSQTYIKGSQGVALGAIIVKAGDATDMRVTSLTLKDTTGTVGAANLINTVSTASLWNGSTQVGSTKSPAATTGDLTFDNLNLTVPAGQSITLTLKGNLSSTATLGTIIYGLAANADLSVTDKDGNSVNPTGAAFVFNAMTVANAGTVTVALAPDDTESEAGLVVAGTSNVVLAKYKFSATNEELKLVKVRLNTLTANAVSSISLYDGSTLVGGPIGVDGLGNADFTGLNFVVPKDGTKVLTVKANLGSVGTGGATTNSDLKISMVNTAGTFEVRGTSAGSSTLITTFAGSPLNANTKAVVKTKPTFSIVSLPSTLLGNGDKTVARFTVSADAAGDVALKRVTFNVALTDAGAAVPVLSVAAVGANSSVRPVGGDFIAGTYTAGVVVFTNDEVIAAGTSKTYELVLTVAGAGADDSIVTKLTQTATWAAANTVAGIGATDLVWSDISASGHAVGTSDWMNGYKVKGLPTDSWTMSL